MTDIIKMSYKSLPIPKSWLVLPSFSLHPFPMGLETLVTQVTVEVSHHFPQIPLTTVCVSDSNSLQI